MAIKIEFLSDIKDLLRGTKKVSDELDDISDNLGDVGKSGDRSSDQLTDGFKSVGKGVDKAGDEVQTFEEKASKAFKAVAQDADKSGKGLGDSTKQGLDKASDGLDNFKEEANSTAKESAASFDGSADSIAGSFQEIAANAFAGFGPAGAAAGLALAAGFGIAQAALQGNADKANELGEKVGELAQEIRDVGGDLASVDFNGKMEEWGLGIQDTKEWWELFQDEAKTGLDTIRDKAKAAGVGWVEAFRGTKGTMEDSEKALAAVDKQLQEATASARTYVDASTGTPYMDGEDRKRIDALKDLKTGYEENVRTQQRAQEAAQLLEQAGVKTQEQLEREEQALEAVNDELTEHASKLSEAAGSAISADKAALDYADTLKSAADDIKTNGKSIDQNTAAGRANQATLLELAESSNSLIDAQIRQGGSTADVTAKSQAARDSFIRAAEAAGYGTEEARKLADRYGLVPKNVDTMVKAHNVQETKNSLDRVADPRTATINLTRGTESVTDWIRGLQNKTYEVPIMLRPRQGAPLP